jgi:hypothetical protein
MPSPLRPELYQRLKRRFSPVAVACEGEAFWGRVITDLRTGRKKLDVDVPGEYYRINCPFCKECRQRLWINHRWGLYVPELDSANLWLAYCYNEECLRQPGRAKYLFDWVFDDFPRGLYPDPVLPGVRAPAGPGRFQPPGEVVPLEQVPPDHPACQYLRSRGFEPARLSTDYGVGLCVNAAPGLSDMVYGRLVVPVLFKGKAVGWQARLVGEPLPHTVPKYYTMRGFRKSEYLYNFDVASRFPFVVVCEGVTGVWTFGPEAVALFGKTASHAQIQLLQTTWKAGAVIVLLDGDAEAEAQKLFDGLANGVQAKVLVRLPNGQDPGDWPPDELRRMVFEAARTQGVDLLRGSAEAG